MKNSERRAAMRKAQDQNVKLKSFADKMVEYYKNYVKLAETRIKQYKYIETHPISLFEKECRGF